jgi:hypothetical protein
LEVLLFFGCALDCAGVFCVRLGGAYEEQDRLLVSFWVGGAGKAHGDDTFVAFAESLESVGLCR